MNSHSIVMVGEVDCCDHVSHILFTVLLLFIVFNFVVVYSHGGVVVRT